MLRMSAAVMGVFGLIGLAVADPPSATTSLSPDLASLQGYWKPLSVEFEGKPQMTADQMKQVTVVFDQSEYHLYFVEKDKNGQPKPLRLAQLNVTVDGATNPKSIAMEYAEGPLKGQKRHGIFEVAGNQLKLCYGPADKPKPNTFAAPANSGLFLEVWAKQPMK